MASPPRPRRLPLPTRLPIGTVNAYLLEADPLTLVDTGPKVEATYDALVRGLRRRGHAVADLGRLVITHGHVDHYGLAHRLRRESGAEVLAPEGDHRMVEDFEATYARRRSRYREVLVASGAPEATGRLVEEFFAYLATLGEPTRVDRTVGDGDVIAGRSVGLRAIRTPGHSMGSTCYRLPDGDLLAGDTLIPGLTPIAAFGSADGRGVGLGDYLRSLDRLRDLPVRRVLPGHRQPFDDLRGYVDGQRAAFAARQGAVVAALADGPATAWDLVLRLFGTLPVEEVFLGITEVLGHLELLVADGRVTVQGDGEVRRYALARPEPSAPDPAGDDKG